MVGRATKAMGRAGAAAGRRGGCMMNEQSYYHAAWNRDRLVHIADPDPHTCEALSVLFRLEGFETAFSMDAAALFLAIERRRPDVVAVNFRLGLDDGLQVLRRLKSLELGTAIFMLIDEPDVEATVEAMKAGAAGVIPKPIDTEHFLRAVHDALRKDVRIAAEPDGGRRVEIRGFAQLTPREREVLQRVTNGQSNKETGRELGISPRTVEVHRARVMAKLGARNTADLMRIVLTS
jgi:FixJ family two-component response regulator